MEAKPSPQQSVSAYDDAARVAEYDSAMEIMHPNRAKMADVVCAMLPFDRSAEATILDLGTGTGFLASRLLDAFPYARIIAVDGAEAMMQQAKARLGVKSNRLTWKTCAFQQLVHDNTLPSLDAVVASFALHHLTADEKLQLYQALLPKLQPDGWLVNADIVYSPHSQIEDRYQYLRRKGIQQRLCLLRGEEKSLEEIAAYLTEVERKDGDQPLPLEVDLDLLRKAGFSAVDCFWKETREAVWGARK